MQLSRRVRLCCGAPRHFPDLQNARRDCPVDTAESGIVGWLTETEGCEPIDIGSYKFIYNKYFQASVDATKVELYARP